MRNIRLIVLLPATFLVITASFASAQSKPSGSPTPEPRVNEFNKLISEAGRLFQQAKYDEALAKCAKAADLRPGDQRPHSLAGYTYMRLAKLKEASDAFAKAISLDPGNAK